MADTKSSQHTLRGMTWTHERAIDPLLHCSQLWREQSGAAITWDDRSLQDFESFPLEQLAESYDLIIIDHPHVGSVADANCLVPFLPSDNLDRAHIGQSWDSYRWNDKQWALPIDAAAQVQAYRPDLVTAAKSYDELLSLEVGQIAIPLAPPHSILSFMTLMKQFGGELNSFGFPLDEAMKAFDMLSALTNVIDRSCFESDPIQVLDAASKSDSEVRVVPIIFGYVSYSRPGFSEVPIRFSNLPQVDGSNYRGSVLGGTGIAISSRSTEIKAAQRFATWITGENIQAGPYVVANGQPSHESVWNGKNGIVFGNGFFIETYETLESAWVRPRHKGFIEFQEAGSNLLNTALVRSSSAETVIGDLNGLFGEFSA